MSRHEFEAPGVSLAIGWDAPLATFYLQVWSEALQTPEMDEEERAGPVANPQRLPRVDHAARMVPPVPEATP